MSNIVAIVGRPNVGKSTLFNRLTESRKAIVDEVSGVTRDRHYGKAEWNGREFSIIDTGGYVHGSDDIFEGEIRRQVQLAIDEAKTILFVVDARDGLTGMDEAVAKLLRKSKRKIILVANKVDTGNGIAATAEFYKLGLGEPMCIASISGSGTGEVLDELVKNFDPDTPDETEGLPKFAISGKPNVGKSSLLNALIGQERSIVTPIAGTTRDSINTHYNYFGHNFVLIDTAGIRKKSKVKEDLEFYSVMRSIGAIEDCDVCLLVIDAALGIEEQDMNILHLAETNRKGVIILVNKWDLVEGKEANTIKEYEKTIRQKIAPFKDIPILLISALTKQRIMKSIEMAEIVFKNRTKKIPTKKLMEAMIPIIEKQPPASVKGRFVRIKFIRQLPTHAPSFAFYCTSPQYVSEGYKRFLENKLRENFDFSGIPIQLFMRKTT